MGLDTEIINFSGMCSSPQRNIAIYTAIRNQGTCVDDKDIDATLTKKTIETLLKKTNWGQVTYGLCKVCHLNSLDLTRQFDRFVPYGKICSDCLTSTKHCIYNINSEYMINTDSLCHQCREDGDPCERNTVLCSLIEIYHNYPNIDIIDCPKHTSYDVRIVVDTLDVEDTIRSIYEEKEPIQILRKKIQEKYHLISETDLECATVKAYNYYRNCPKLSYS